jgi:hypothetical protein
MKFTPEKYVELVITFGEGMLARIPEMMATYKDEIDAADEAEKDKVIMSHLMEVRAVVEQELLPEGVTADTMMAYERSGKAELGKYFAAHPDIKKKLDDLQFSMKKATWT